MEKEEFELIMRLKNTKLVEEQAHQHLERAINEPLQSSGMSKKIGYRSKKDGFSK